MRPVAGLVLTGGRSRRMGFDKATVEVDGQPLARRVLRELVRAASPVVEVGRGVSGAEHWTCEEPPGSGPLAAIAAGAKLLAQLGYDGAVLVVACDLPRLDGALLAWLAQHPAPGSVVPVVAGHPQPLCARWSSAAVRAVPHLVAEGARSLRPLLARPDVVLANEQQWAAVAAPAALADADVPADLDAAGVHWVPPAARPARIPPEVTY